MEFESVISKYEDAMREMLGGGEELKELNIVYLERKLRETGKMQENPLLDQLMRDVTDEDMPLKESIKLLAENYDKIFSVNA